MFAMASRSPAIFNCLLRMMHPLHTGGIEAIPVEMFVSKEEPGCARWVESRVAPSPLGSRFHSIEGRFAAAVPAERRSSRWPGHCAWRCRCRTRSSRVSSREVMTSEIRG